MSGSTRRKDDTDSDDALRELVSSILSGRYTEETYLADVASVCRARPHAAPRLLSLIDRYRRLGRMQAPQHQRIKARIEEVLKADRPAQPRRHAAPPPPPPAAEAAPVSAVSPEAADDDDEDCPTSELVATARGKRPAALTMVLTDRPADERPGDERTRIIPPPAARPPAAAPPVPPPAPRAQESAPPPPEASRYPLNTAETRILETRVIHGPALVAGTGATRAPPSAEPVAVAAPVAAEPGALPGIVPIGVGTVLHDRYEFRQLLGRGGIAMVYKAVDRYRVNLGLEDCYVAVKIVQPHPSRPGSVAALGREFHNAQLLSHPNVINVFNIDHAGDASFYTMELLDGERLSQIVKRIGMLSRRHALTIIRDIGAAVAHAHSRSVVHADLKPHNIMITQAGSLRVLDFGSGIIRAREPWISELSPADSYRQATPAYASCEQLEGWSADPRDDIYALACVAYLLLAGRHPFNMRPSLEARARRMQPRRPPGLSGESWRALQRGLSWTREERTMSVEDWLRDLGVDHAAESLPPLALLQAGRPPGTWLQRAAAASVIIAGLGLAAFTVEHQDEFDWQGTLSRAQDRLHGVWQSLTDTSPDAADVQPAVSLPPIPPPSPTILHKSIQDLAQNQQQASAAGQSQSRTATRAATGDTSTSNAAGATGAAAGGPPHLEFSESSYVVPGSDPAARIVIRRNGSTEGNVNFVWWTEEASAKADVDYASLGRRVESIPSGSDKITVYVPIISSSQHRGTTQFYVALSEPGQRGDGPESRSMVTIDNGS